LQCISTVAILAREANSWRLAVRMVVAYLCLAWLAAWLTFQIAAAV
jgi:Fe2+ transport system protein B